MNPITNNITSVQQTGRNNTIAPPARKIINPFATLYKVAAFALAIFLIAQHTHHLPFSPSAETNRSTHNRDIISLHSLGACKYLQDPETGTLDASCDAQLGAIPKESEYVMHGYSRKKIKCVSLKLPEGQLLYARGLSPLVEKIVESEPARLLLNQALKAGPLTLLLGDKKSAPAGGKWVPAMRQIYIQKEEHPDRQLGHLLFEIVNALRTEEQLSLKQKCEQGLVGKELYVKKWEQMEYEAAKTFTSAVMQCISRDHWPQPAAMDFPQIFANPPTWKQFWEMIKHTSHADLFRKNWDDGVKPDYCAKNPKKPDCH